MVTFNDVLGVTSRPFDGRTVADMLGALEGLPALASYRMGKSLRSLKQVTQDFYEQRDQLIKKHGQPRDDGEYSVDPDGDPDAFKAYSQEISELTESEPVDLKIYPISLSDLEGVDVKPVIFEMAGFLFEVDDEA